MNFVKTHQQVLFNLFWVALLIGCIWTISLAPALERSNYKSSQNFMASVFYDEYQGGDETAVDRLLDLAYSDNGMAYLHLDEIYREKAVKAAGIDLLDPEANLSAIDFSKSDALLMTALNRVSDFELYVLLQRLSLYFDNNIIEPKETNLGEALQNNRSKIAIMTGLSDAQKDRLRACKSALEDLYFDPIMFGLRYNSTGTCSEYAGKSPAFSLHGLIPSLFRSTGE